MDYNMQKFRCNCSRPRVSPNRSIVSDSVSPLIGIARHHSDFLLGFNLDFIFLRLLRKADSATAQTFLFPPRWRNSNRDPTRVPISVCLSDLPLLAKAIATRTTPGYRQNFKASCNGTTSSITIEIGTMP